MSTKVNPIGRIVNWTLLLFRVTICPYSYIAIASYPRKITACLHPYMNICNHGSYA